MYPYNVWCKLSISNITELLFKRTNGLEKINYWLNLNKSHLEEKKNQFHNIFILKTWSFQLLPIDLIITVYLKRSQPNFGNNFRQKWNFHENIEIICPKLPKTNSALWILKLLMILQPKNLEASLFQRELTVSWIYRWSLSTICCSVGRIDYIKFSFGLQAGTYKIYTSSGWRLLWALQLSGLRCESFTDQPAGTTGSRPVLASVN